MEVTTKNRLVQKLNGKKARTQLLSAAAFSALLICLSVAFILRQLGIAATHTERVLECPATGVVAHAHDASCYDDEGNLVCPLPERELHVHDDSCYEEVRELVCGLEEGEDHVHDDTCYEVTRELVCGQEEISQEHVHGPGCFREVEVEDGADLPAQSFSHAFNDEDDNLVLRVDVDAPEGALPEGSTIQVEWVDPAELTENELAALDGALEAKTEGRRLDSQAFDLMFVDAEGVEVEPALPVCITLTSMIVNGSEEPVVLRLADAQAETLDTLSEQELLDRDMALADDQLAFEADGASAYVLAAASRELEMRAEGDDVTVTVNAPAAAGIPQGATVQVSEITQDTVEYEAYAGQALEAVGAGGAELARFFDIKIVDSLGNELQPQAPVEVKIKLADAPTGAPQPTVVHFAEAEGEVVPEVVPADAHKRTTTFEAEGFSVYGVVYTVDYHYEVDGNKYEFSLPGGGFVSLRRLVEELGIATGEDAKQFVANVASVEFSSPELVWVGQVDEASTVGGLKEANGLDVEYSAELTEEQIAEINAQTVEAGDWALIGVHPFTSIEGLTVTMQNGDQFVVSVTDAQITKTVIDAKGDTWEIAVTYGDDAQIPDGTELQVTAYTKDDLLYNDLISEREKWVSDAAGAGDISNQHDGVAESVDGMAFEPGFGDTINYDVAAEPTEEDKAEALSHMQTLRVPEISGYLLFDIALVYEGNEIEPAAPVQVTIQSTSPELQDYDDISVGHYVEGAGDVESTGAVENAEDVTAERRMEAINEVFYGTDDSNGAQVIVDFETTSFSLYDVAGIQWTANQSKTVYFALKTGINKVLDVDQNGAIPVTYSDIANMDPAAVSAYIRSLPDYANAEPIVIYDKSGTNFYAIDGNGNLAQVYESGDMVLWNGQPSIGWKLVRYMNDAGEYTGYYDFINMETGKFLAPQSDQTISDTRIGVQLDGAGEHNTTIKAWDSAANAYYGYSIKNNQLVTSDSIEWYFASVSQTVSDDLKLQTVDTVDSTALGITIKMFNYPMTGNTNNRTDFQRNFRIVDAQNRDWISGGPVIQGLVKNTLNSNGFPVTRYTNNDLDGLFTGSSNVTATNANHLFIQQTYDETGYFEYSSFENYAHLESNGDFTVYRQIGVEDTAYTPKEKTYGNSTDYFFNRGNFLPYNTIADYKTATQKYGATGTKPGVTNKYDEDGNRLPGDDPRNGEAIFLTQETVDYFFGMSMEANFYQPVDGKNNGEDVVYEFNGDDDLWVFIDNVLVLDIGGTHNAHSGSINFRTGDVWVETGNGIARTTIKQCFEDAHIFPDGTPWDPTKVDQYFKDDTFVDYSQHNMKTFYMERGAGASNLHLKFNVPVVKDAGKLIVDKVVSGTQNEKYSNDKFPFQVIKVSGGHETRFTNAVYESTGEPVEYQHSVNINGTTYEDVFFLRPGEAAVFDVANNQQQYYVRELGINTDYYDRVLINQEEANISSGIAQSSTNSVKNRNRVTYDNHGVTEDLNIKKVVEGDVKNTDDQFEFYVYLTGPNQQLIPYSNGEYYVLDPEDHYCTYVNGKPVGDSTITEETRTAYHSGQWGSVGSIPDGYTVLIPDLLVGTDFMVSERMDNLPTGYELKSIAVNDGTANSVDIVNGYTNVTASGSDAITVGAYSFSNHCEGKLKLDGTTDATVTVTNQAAHKLTVSKTWKSGDFVTEHGPVNFALYRLDNGNEVLVEGSVKTLNAPDLTMEYRIVGDLANYVVREVVVTTSGGQTTVTPVENNGIIEVSGETTTLGTNKTDSYIVTYEKGEATATSRTDTVTNEMPKLNVNKQDMEGHQLAGAKFKLTGKDGETTLTGYGNLESDSKASGNLLKGAYLSNGTYYLVETKAPDGYNALAYKVKIVVSGTDARTVFAASTEPESMTTFTDETADNIMLYTFTVQNNPGVELPASGGSGTMLIYLVGIAMMALAAMGLVVHRRQTVA